jgi:hypothetical protein
MTDDDWLSALAERAEHSPPTFDPNCGHCRGPSGPEGAWCDNCIRECRDYTGWLDSQAVGGAR